MDTYFPHQIGSILTNFEIPSHSVEIQIFVNMSGKISLFHNQDSSQIMLWFNFSDKNKFNHSAWRSLSFNNFLGLRTVLVKSVERNYHIKNSFDCSYHCSWPCCYSFPLMYQFTEKRKKKKRQKNPLFRLCLNHRKCWTSHSVNCASHQLDARDY